MADGRRDPDRRLAQLVEEQAALRRVATLVARGITPGELFSAVSTEVGKLFGADAVISRFESDGTAMVVVGLTDGIPVLTIGTRWELEDFSASTAVCRTGRTVRSPQKRRQQKSGAMAGALRERGVVSSISAPIVVEGKTWGVVAVAQTRKPLPQDAEERLERFTELVATTIANSQAREDVAQLAAEQAALRRVATLVARGVSPDQLFSEVNDEVGGLFDSEASIARFEPDGSAVVIVAQTAGIPIVSIGTRWELDDLLATTRVYRTGRPARNDWTGLETAAGPTAERLRTMNFASTVAAPIVVEGGLWGVMTVSHRRERLPPDTEERVERFTELVATAIANAESQAALAASRARIIAASDDARRRIERNLHDGAQQQLVTLTVALRRAEAKIPTGSTELRADLTRVAEGLTTAIEELRELSQGIHPSILTEGGLSPALKVLGRRSPVRVKIDMGFERRLPDHAEVAAYYTVSEALTNASKHATATRTWVSLHVENDALLVSIRDDGVGGADTSLGSGLTGLRDRVEALGGRIQIESPPGRGTLIEVAIPIAGTN